MLVSEPFAIIWKGKKKQQYLEKFESCKYKLEVRNYCIFRDYHSLLLPYDEGFNTA